MVHSILKSFALISCALSVSCTPLCRGKTEHNVKAEHCENAVQQTAYIQTNLAANKPEYGASLLFPEMINAWGIAIRPAGAGGHFWVTASGISHEFVGDVTASADPVLRILHQDELKTVTIPNGKTGNATGMVFNEAKQFVITQAISGKQAITAPAKFITATDTGIVSAWTEQKLADGSFDRSPAFTTVADFSGQGAQIFGVALSEKFDRLFLADFGMTPRIRVLDGSFKELPVAFANPFDENKNGKVDAGEFAPFNIQSLTHPDGSKSLFVSYAKLMSAGEELSLDASKEGENPDMGKLVEFDYEGHVLAVWRDEKKLNAPWGLAFAPQYFGAFSGMLLVGNFGGRGRIAVFDPQTKSFVAFMRGQNGEAIGIPGLWGIIFGNGASLGDANALYFAAGPEDEKDGLFGTLRAAP